MKRTSLSALLAAGLLSGGLTATSAMAADLGGNCCADLEERIAELEATTARKGNRKVSLTISGFVAQQVLAWDDGVESNVYVTDTGSISIGTHVKFAGQATIAPGWTAGYVLKIEAMNNDSLTVSQDKDDSGNAFAGSGNFSLESSYWFIKSDHLGRLSVGQQSGAVDNLAILPDGSGSLVVANYVLYDLNGFFLRNKNGTLTNVNWGSLATCQTFGDGLGAAGDCEGDPNNNVRYDTPTWAGFSASASWGEDDVWGIAARYAGEFSGFKVAGAIGYTHRTDDNAAPIAKANGGLDAGALEIGAYAQHIATGLFVYGAYIAEDHDTTNSARGGGKLNPEGDNWYIKVGIRQKWNPLGHTVLYGEYGEDEDKQSAALFDAGIDNSEFRQWGLGIVQEIDSAAMSIWLAYRHYEGEAFCSFTVGSCGTGTGVAGNFALGQNDFEDFDLVKAGALINF